MTSGVSTAQRLPRISLPLNPGTAVLRLVLLPRHRAQRRVDALLPARSGVLEVIEHVTVDAQGDEFLAVGERWRLRRSFYGFRRRHLECCFGGMPRVG